MSVAITVEDSDLDRLIEFGGKLGGVLTSEDLLLVAGRSMQQTTKEHFEELSRDEIHHESSASLGAERTGFYEEAAQAVQQPVIAGSGSVSISITGPVGLAQRFFGGTIDAKAGGYLTIPANAEAYGHRARDFADLDLVIFGNTGIAALVQKHETPLKRKRGEVASSVLTYDEGDVFFWLVRSVTQQPDPTVMPSAQEILDPAILAMRDHLSEVMSREGAIRG